MGKLARAALGQGCVRDAAANFVVGGIVSRTAGRYGDRAARYVGFEAGAAAQNMLLMAVALNLGAVVVGAYDDDRVRDLARFMGVSHVTVTRIVARLQAEALVDTEPYRPIRLTAAGERLAARCRARHRAVYDFLRALGVPEDEARRDARHAAAGSVLLGS